MTQPNESQSDEDRRSPKSQDKLDMLSTRSPDQPTGQSIRRILREWREISENKNPFWTANLINPDEPYEWHFTIRGPTGTAFEGGVYHGRLVLPMTYPMTPPTLFFMTPNGRFEVHKKVCLSATNFHPECWQPAWGIRSILDALHAFFPTPAEGAVHALDWPDHSRRQLAESSQRFICPVCQRSNLEIVTEKCLPLPASANKVKSMSAAPLSAPPSTEVNASKVQPAEAEATEVLSPEEERQKRLEDIRRRRTPQISRAQAAPSHKAMLQHLPSIFVFLYYLVFFLAQVTGSTVYGLCLRMVGTSSTRGRQIMPWHLVLMIVCFGIIIYANIILLAYARKILLNTFFLLDVPIRQTFQTSTNPSPDQIRSLSNAERYEDFPLHPWIKTLFEAFWAAV